MKESTMNPYRKLMFAAIVSGIAEQDEKYATGVGGRDPIGRKKGIALEARRFVKTVLGKAPKQLRDMSPEHAHKIMREL